VVQDRAAEHAAAAELHQLGLRRLADTVRFAWGLTNPDDLVLPGDQAANWLDVMIAELPRLRRAGWNIEVDPDFPWQIVEAAGDITAELEEGSGIDWLELHLGVLVEGERLDLVPGLVKLIAAAPGPGFATALDAAPDDAPFAVPLPDGRLLSVPLGRIRTMVLALSELFAGGGIEAETGRVGFTRLDAADLAILETAVPDLVWQGGEALRTLGRQLREAGGAIPHCALPGSFQGTLRPYQAQGVDWLQFLRGAGIGGVLADDMGLGKTVQTLAHLAIEHAAGRLGRPALIVCPTSLVPNWAMEAERFVPGLRLLVLHGPARKERFGDIPGHDLVITSYKLLSRDAEVLSAQEWHLLVLDEAQTIKNPAAETTKMVGQLRAGQRLCLSGTPLENHLGELWSLFHFLAPGFLGNAKSFRGRYRVPIEKHGDDDRRALLARRVRPFLLRRTKEEVATDLPPKTEIVEQVELESAQRAIYESIRLAMHARVRQAIAERGLARSGIIILGALLKLRQACCDPRLLKLAAVKRAQAGSAKLERLMELLETLLDEGRRVLVFSQFTSMLALIIPRLDAADIPFALLTGDTVDRQMPIRRFQSGEVPVFLLSLKAGGTGLNLTAADTVIHYDPWWNPAVEDQATDRAHRIGQDKNVFVHRLVTIDTIEAKMETLKARKRALVAGILDAEHGGALAMTEADIELLFG
ncbi:MAG TPA: DEAD/DEAH box helicase, partial [Acetobacteraceae bacterium]|nr:DEAD/DEAH box helicase [Acetobacteraceae bacterium]